MNHTIIRLLALAAPSTLIASHALSAQAAERPNIVFIYTDDQAPWALGQSGNSQARTPNLDRLFRQGAYLVNCFTTTPVCSPSRRGFAPGTRGSRRR